jgi:hypothetical protein
MTSQAKIDANRRNSLKSTGPKTPEGLARSSMNALKHGMRSKKQALLDEDSYAFENRLHKWVAIADPDDDVGEFLVHQYVSLSFQLERLERAQLERLTSQIENSEESELDAVHELGKRLFFDPVGPTALYGNRSCGLKTKTSWNGLPVDPHEPAVLVRKLESTATGCHWLRQSWEELRAQLEPGNFWQSHDRLKAIRLLGRQPIDAIEDRRVAEIFVASHALEPGGGGAFDELASDMVTNAHERFRKAVRARWRDLPSREEPEKCRQLLIELVDRHIERLDAKLEVYEENADAITERTIARLSFDPSPEGECLRRHQMRCMNAFFRAIDMHRKYQRDKGRDRRGRRQEDEPRRIPDAALWAQDSRRTVPDAARWGHGTAASDRARDEAFAAEPGVSEALQPAFDSEKLPDRPDQPESQNATNEANVAGDAVPIQDTGHVELAANSDVDWSLDKPADQPAEVQREDDGLNEESQEQASEAPRPIAIVRTEDAPMSSIERLEPSSGRLTSSTAPHANRFSLLSSVVDDSLALAYHPRPTRSRFRGSGIDPFFLSPGR